MWIAKKDTAGWRARGPFYILAKYLIKLSSAILWNIDSIPTELAVIGEEVGRLNFNSWYQLLISIFYWGSIRNGIWKQLLVSNRSDRK